MHRRYLYGILLAARSLRLLELACEQVIKCFQRRADEAAQHPCYLVFNRLCPSKDSAGLILADDDKSFHSHAF